MIRETLVAVAAALWLGAIAIVPALGETAPEAIAQAQKQVLDKT